MAARFTVETTADVALSAATAKTILSVIAPASGAIRLVEFSVSFDGTSATAEPVTVELCKSTEATAGTSTSQTPVQSGGTPSGKTARSSGKRNFTAEATTLTVLKTWLVHPQTGFTKQSPLGREEEQDTRHDSHQCSQPCVLAPVLAAGAAPSGPISSSSPSGALSTAGGSGAEHSTVPAWAAFINARTSPTE